MINNAAFGKRLKKVLDYYQLSASSFAEKIKVQRSSISHLLSGRNKPSLDFVLKVLQEFEEVEMYWLLNGTGSFPKKELLSTPTSIPTENNPIDLFSQKQGDIVASSETSKNHPKEMIQRISSENNSPIIERIVIFYTDGSFKNYTEF